MATKNSNLSNNTSTDQTDDDQVLFFHNKLEEAINAIKDIEIEAISSLSRLSLNKLAKLKSEETKNAVEKLEEIRKKINQN
ncbi:hypothetical protein CVU82_00975 [Candidatus Falkowbacteria bacterium HGW-Falkowbacteria-1]|uniref:Uncharacterized protein n=1 Tax=Candidatus Falkowbacteria bacterium HGW-Falkowbacteria-1 TaxID=2013768 RepID=A0A2N2EAJ6_9BACT|nr:MAG: hypothetical protein CVU82_00975 [Candidatus Falkowbacteria bacterium HGW-Falkowbacteria-1]